MTIVIGAILVARYRSTGKRHSGADAVMVFDYQERNQANTIALSGDDAVQASEGMLSDIDIEHMELYGEERFGFDVDSSDDDATDEHVIINK